MAARSCLNSWLLLVALSWTFQFAKQYIEQSNETRSLLHRNLSYPSSFINWLNKLN